MELLYGEDCMILTSTRQPSLTDPTVWQTDGRTGDGI